MCSVAKPELHGVPTLASKVSVHAAHLVSEDQCHNSTRQLNQQTETKDVHELRENNSKWDLKQNKSQLLFQLLSLKSIAFNRQHTWLSENKMSLKKDRICCCSYKNCLCHKKDFFLHLSDSIFFSQLANVILLLWMQSKPIDAFIMPRHFSL